MLDTGPHRPITTVAGDAQSLADMFLRRVAADGARNAFFEKVDGRWSGVTYDAWADASARVAGGLVGLGLEPGDRVAILGPTRSPWAIHDIGAHLAGGVSMGIYPKQSVEQVRYLLEHSEAKVVTVADEGELRTVLAAIEGLDSVVAVVPWDAALMSVGDDPRLTAPSIFTSDPISVEERDRRIGAIGPDDTAIFVYTSGTTGAPKCAMITHGNILWLLESISGHMPIYTDDITMSFLPMAHVAERVLAFYNRINSGFATAYATNIAAVLNELGEVRPTVWGSVPRLFEKAYGRVLTELERKPPLVQTLFHWALAVGKDRMAREIDGRSVPLWLKLRHAIADRLVLSKIRAAFGGRLRFVLTGAAPTPLDVLEFFWAAGIPLYEVYGQTEGTVVSHGNIHGNVRLGTVGRCYDGLECRIAEDGEILIRGKTVFKGYFKNPEATAETIVDGWLHTGDIGSIDADGFLRITDRKKHIIITAGGKNLTPAHIQGAIKAADPLIGGVHAHGDRRPYITALIAPSPIETLMFGLDRGLVTEAELEARTAELMDNPSGRTQALADALAPVTRHPDYQARMRAAVAKGNAKLARVEQVRRFHIIGRDFSQEAGELTPTMKLKRKAVEAAYTETFDRIYDEDGFALEP